jgi:uncharacterized membrane protein
MKRLNYIDVLRGVAVLWMITLQTLTGLGFINMYAEFHTIIGQWFNWLPLFMMLVGFSLMLSFERRKGFVKRNLKRAILLIILGVSLSLLMGWPLFDEAISSIGVAIIIMIPFILTIQKHKLLWFPSALIMFANSVWLYDLGNFNPPWLLSFMFVGAGLYAILRA